MQIHVVAAHDGGAVPDLVHDIAYDDDRSRQVSQEELLDEFDGRLTCVADRPSTRPELSHEYEAIEDEANP